MVTPISAAHDFVAFPPPSSAIKPDRDDGVDVLVITSDPAPSSSSSSEAGSSNGDDELDGTDSEDEARVASALVGPRRSKGSRRVGAPLFRAHSASSSDDNSDGEDRGAQAHELQPDDDGVDSDAILDLEEAVQ